MRRPLSIRVKLTLWYFGATCVALCLFGVFSYGALRFALLHLKKDNLMRREQRLLAYLAENRSRQLPTPLNGQLQNYVVIAHEGNLFEMRDPGGSILFPAGRSGSSNWPPAFRSNCANPEFAGGTDGGEPIEAMCHAAVIDSRPVLLLFGGSLADDIYVLRTYTEALLALLPALMCLAAFIGFHLGKRAMGPVDRMTRAALDIGIGNLSARLPEPAAHDELWSLAVAWNQLLDRLEKAVLRLSRFSADASHDLRTSITVMLATAELSLRSERSSAEMRDALSRIVSECRTACTLLDALLSVSRSDNFAHEVALRRINAAELVVAACRRVEDLAESNGILLDWKLPEEDLWLEGDELLLQRLLGILLDNAIKYTPERGEISVELTRDDRGIVLAVRDTGVGISQTVQQQIFQRYYQGDLRERKNQAGNGLGLSIARWIAEAHRAQLRVESIPALGSTFEVRFPSARVGSMPHVSTPGTLAAS